jgi:hypothetical protein
VNIERKTVRRASANELIFSLDWATDAERGLKGEGRLERLMVNVVW